jgi:hypothetical protein
MERSTEKGSAARDVVTHINIPNEAIINRRTMHPFVYFQNGWAAYGDAAHTISVVATTSDMQGTDGSER